MKIMKVLSLLAVIILVASCNQNGATQKALTTEIDSVSYAIGMDVAKNVKASFDEFDGDLFMQGFNNVSDSTNILLDEAKAQQVVRAYFQKKQQADAAKLKEEGENNKIEGEKFLAENKTKDGVVTTDSGLQYIVLKEGTGAKPTTSSKVKVHYHGTLIDGTVFDSSVDRGEPTEFGVTQVIKGWTEGLQLMKEGAKYKFFIPSDIAYGANPRPGGAIKPNSTLIFDVELLEVK
ncbi:FKBP-type peptidyl-prolyl cis-trans isomerase [Algibacter amylolyticus]|uniref:Peptidyl-prolyl cis-trans isomerase n=1 Tax=Algibacter amylolyticus TaxID=1608400 RepID=A0A5M7BBZ6_9FLAO|nr:FKBP-type peptidyl-prolyl cis-trans isomerase [Algibacter amylolyticus]KAA5826220.1 FKBP-type peptidyl-prolyl cis-trans isomerase [Algibacter amylolyticus]MBB5268422.1 FKBP-type peptidyl-prolyl cis-trans isomerase FklB [Algibacter amylolyticus]TSJ80258.1 FKBP-type peptidyl-prolyl cis-trans isomerase [Algibacter amylolyticus]